MNKSFINVWVINPNDGLGVSKGYKILPIVEKPTP